MSEVKIDEIEGELLEERLRQLQPRERLVFVPLCECGHFPSPLDPDVEIEADLEKVPPVFRVICPKCGRKVECEVIGGGGRA